MIITDRHIIENMPFSDYLKLPGLSYSTIKNNGIPIQTTAKMRFGSLVDAFTFEPATYTGEQRELVRPISRAVMAELGPAIKYGKRQLVVTCRMEHMGMYIIYKGRLDLALPKLVIDMKVSALNQLSAINHFGYHNQLNGYALAYGTDTSLLFSIHPKTLKISRELIPTKPFWWEEQVLRFGKPLKEIAA